MSVATPERKTQAPSAPPAPQFWRNYSPHHEFSISTAASGALHVLGVVLFIFVAMRLMKPDEKTPVPVRGMVVVPEPVAGTLGSSGSGGGDERVEARDNEPRHQPRTLPEVELNKEITTAKVWIPELQDNPERAKVIVQSPNFDRLKDLNDDLKKRLASGFNNKSGSGSEKGSGNTKEPGTGTGGKGPDATTSGSRSVRWTIVFKTNSGADYLKQLNAFKAKVVIPEPPDWKTSLLFENILEPNPGKPLRDEDLPKMHFIDNDRTSAVKVARALGLKFNPPYFIAFFPKDVEDELAAKERAFRNRKEDEIAATTFRIVERKDDYEIRVTDQEAIKK